MKIDSIEHTLNGYRALHPVPENYESLRVYLSSDECDSYASSLPRENPNLK